MTDLELDKLLGKAIKLRELKRARARVIQLERELHGEPAKPEEPFYVPEFLAQQPSRPAVRPTLSVVEGNRNAA